MWLYLIRTYLTYERCKPIRHFFRQPQQKKAYFEAALNQPIMKKLLILFLVIPIIVFGQEKKLIDFNDITEVNGIFIFKINENLVTGKVNEYY